MDSTVPRFSWKLKSEERGKYQEAFQIIVSTSARRLDRNEGDAWNSGRVEVGESLNIEYGGMPLESGKRYFWKVVIWDEKSNKTRFSEKAWFETGKMDPADWKANWISGQEDSPGLPVTRPAPYFRKEFRIEKKIEKARLYISGLGYYHSFINGQRVGDHELDPAFTRYDRRVKYVIYDIDSLLRNGDNCIGVVLGNGWYNQHTRSAWDLDSAAWRNDPVLLAELVIGYADGTETIIVSDESWKTGKGPIVFDGIRNGVHYDARKEMEGWSEPGFDDGNWKMASTVKGPAGLLSAQVMPPIRKIRKVAPVKIHEPRQDVYLLDYGENITGRIRLKTNGSSGQQIVFRYGERLNADGMLDQKELARFIWTGETQTDRYICRGEGTEIWEPSFVYHGFRYVQVEGLTDPPDDGEITALVLHTDLESTGSFRCSNEMFNRLQQNILNSFLGNYHGYPTDCPHREKIGWSGDAQLVSTTALYNFEMIPAYLKWIDDFADEQRDDGKVPAIIPTSGWGYDFGRGPNRQHGYGPHWDAAYINIPYDMYLFTGDSSLLERYYDGFKGYMNYLERSAVGYILEYGIDDHKPVTTITDGDIISSAYYYDLAVKMATIAAITGRPDDSEYYKDLSEKIYTAFNRRFYDKKRGLYGNGGQTSLSMVLYFELVPDSIRSAVTGKLLEAISDNDFHIDAGVVGTRCLVEVLPRLGYPEILYRMADQRDYPGWGYWIEQGATTLWQTWKGDMSLNHIMFGSIGEWFYHGLGGIRPGIEKPGFRKFELRPEIIKGVDWVECRYVSPYGEIRSNWERTDGEFEWSVKIPVNTTASVHLPVSGPDNIVLESGKGIDENKGIKILEKHENIFVLDVPAGEYHFQVR